MTLIRVTFFLKRLLANIWSLRCAGHLFAALGLLWSLVQAIDISFGWNNRNEILPRLFWYSLGTGMLYALARVWPQGRVSCKLRDQDVTVEIRVADIFSLPGSIIVGTNTTFDTEVSGRLIAESSIQGTFTKKFYSSATQLDAELDNALSGESFVEVPGPRVGKRRRYAIGTCIRLHPKGRDAYFLAIANINEHGVAGSNVNNLQSALPKLWEYVATRGLKENLLVPVLGTGFSRLGIPRDRVIHEIILTFLISCSQRTFCDKLTIVVSPQDLARFSISLQELGDFLRHHIRYRSPSALSGGNFGTASA